MPKSVEKRSRAPFSYSGPTRHAVEDLALARWVEHGRPAFALRLRHFLDDFQPTAEELIFALRHRTLGGVRLLLSTRANSPRINITTTAYENPATPPMLCMLLRKRLGGATLDAVRQAGSDRILFLDFLATNELGDREKLTVAIEIMAQYSNVILIGPDGKIIDALKRVDPTKSSKRLILPGLPYELPPGQDKRTN